MKRFARAIVVAILGWQVRRLQKKDGYKIVAVSGSVGKTSTKLAIAKVLSRHFRVQYQEGNYNDKVSVPLIFFGQTMPSLFNPVAWLAIFISNEIKLWQKYPYDVVVLELGSDAPGQLAQFKKYLGRIEIGVLTAITPEHMQFFEDMDAVAREETQIANLATLTLVNKDMCPPQYLPSGGILTYAIEQPADYKMTNLNFDVAGCNFDIETGGTKIFSAQHEAIAEPLLYAVLAAIAVAKKLGMPDTEIQAGLADITPAPGRLQVLNGINGAIIIDDTYNASPEAVKAGLKTLYRLNAPQKVAILGNMNELGKYSEAAHREIGELCDPVQLELVVTIGPDANKFLAPAAAAKGCTVKTFDSPYEAGDYVKTMLKPSALVLAKGSQNGVFAEEAVKQLLANALDGAKLVRQSKQWLRIKHKAFNHQ